jgi:hypothetical protein
MDLAVEVHQKRVVVLIGRKEVAERDAQPSQLHMKVAPLVAGEGGDGITGAIEDDDSLAQQRLVDVHGQSPSVSGLDLGFGAKMDHCSQ